MIINRSDSSKPRKTLSLFDAVCIIVGTIIGAGVFQTAPTIASLAGNAPVMFALWALGAIIAVSGAISFAELTARFSDQTGGDYVFLKSAYGQKVAFLFAWATFWIIRPGNLGAMAFTFAIYFDQLLSFVDHEFRIWRLAIWTVLSIILFSAVNLIGLRQGTWLQNLLTVAKVLGISLIVIAVVVEPSDQEKIGTGDFLPSANWLVAMVFIMFSFGGWNDLSFVASEIKDPEKNLFRALLFGVLTVAIVYLILNLAFLFGVGFKPMSGSDAIAIDVVQTVFGVDSWIGRQGSRLIAALICISCLGAINGIIITSPRIYFAAGRDYPAIRSLGYWDFQTDQPWSATMAQAIVTIGLFVFCLQYKEPFEVIVIASAPFFWAFLALAGSTLFVFRHRAATETGFLAPFYPVEPLLLVISCVLMMVSSAQYMWSRGFWAAGLIVTGLMLIGLVFSWIWTPIRNSGEPTSRSH